MSKIDPPSALDVLEEEHEEVHREFDNDWRHGGTETVIVHRESDDTFWQFCYRVSTDGDYHGLAENDYDVCQVVPKEVTKTVYVRA